MISADRHISGTPVFGKDFFYFADRYLFHVSPHRLAFIINFRKKVYCHFGLWPCGVPKGVSQQIDLQHFDLIYTN